MGHRYVTLIVSIAWALLGIGLARLLLPSSAASSPAALVLSVAAVCSTWAWLGLFVLPALGRRQVLAADAFARDAGMGQTGALAMLDELARRNLPDESLPPIVATVFHPIPPMADRRAAIRGESRVAASKAAGVAALV